MHRTIRTAALVLVPLLLGACTRTDDPTATVDGLADEPTTLVLGSINAHNGQPATDAARLIELVSKTSGGGLEVEFVWTQDPQSDLYTEDHKVERALVNAVADGEIDLGITGTRVFATLGVNSLEFLNAPLLIDSFALQQAVLESDAVSGLLDDLSEVGVSGVGFLPGDLRRPMSATAPLVTPDAWEGVAVHVFDSVLARQAIAALGATPVRAGAGDRDDGLADGSIGGMENTLAFHTGRQSVVPHVPLNLVLWPNPAAVIANPDVLGSLSDQELGWLQEATAQAVAEGIDFGPGPEDLERNCAVGARYVVATDEELASMARAVAPVYEALEADPATAERIDRVRALKETVLAEDPPGMPDACSEERASGERSDGPRSGELLSGVFRGPDWTEPELVDLGLPAEAAPHVAGYFVLAFDEGEFQLRHAQTGSNGPQVQCSGTYTVTGSDLAVDISDDIGCGTVGRFLSGAFEVDGERLVLTDLVAAHPEDALLFEGITWTRVK